MDPTQIPLKDLHLPDAIGWWPVAPGWWVLGALVLLGVILLMRGALRSHAHGAARRRALVHLETVAAEFSEHGNAVELGRQTSELLRRTMLAYAPRADVAGLTGDDWLAWLDRDLSEPAFVSGAGRGLLDLPYRDPDADLNSGHAGADIDGLLSAVRLRIRTPVGGHA